TSWLGTRVAVKQSAVISVGVLLNIGVVLH
ncbi:MAG: hypothetical protein ACJAY2_003314, partial [Pseudomonadales bacterium]